MAVRSSLAIVLTVIMTASAANHYVRQGATGNGSGSDWINACTDFIGACAPANLVRGDAYYVADGSYAARTFGTPAVNNLVITIKKATVLDHGTETGWASSYGDGQAVFSSPVTFSTDDWMLDGSTRDESNPPLSWFTTTAYGFKIANNANAAQVQLKFGAPLDNFTMQYVWIEGRTGPFNGAERRYAIDCETEGTSTNLLFSRNLSTKSNQWYFLRNTNHTTIEYWAGDSLTGDGNNHGDAINVYFTAEDVTIRWGVARDACTEGCTGMVPIADWVAGDGTAPYVRFYGNVLYDYGSSDGSLGFTGSAQSLGNCTNCAVFNNTFIDGGHEYAANWGIQFPHGSGNISRNNIFFQVNSVTPSFNLGSGSTNTHNAFGISASGSGTDAQVNLPTSAFVNFSGKNFKLATPLSVDCGIAMPPPYNVPPYNMDMFGNIRGSDGCWDRGAFEHAAGPLVHPPLQSSRFITSTPNCVYNLKGQKVSIGMSAMRPMKVDRNLQSGVYLVASGTGAQRSFMKVLKME